MDRKKWVRDLINREKEKLSKGYEKETATKEKDIQTKNDQADTLEKFIRTVQKHFEEAKKDIHGPDSPCNIDLIRDNETRLCAIKFNFSLKNHHKSFYLKYEGQIGSDEVKRITDFSGLSRDVRGFPIDHLSHEKIEKHIDDFLMAVGDRI